VFEAAVILAAMGGSAEPAGPTALATQACSRRMAQLAARYEMVDLTSHVVGDTQVLSDGRYLVRLAVTINYDRKGGIERRYAVISCVVNQYGRVDAIDPPRGR
jgi:hypothetical protein